MMPDLTITDDDIVELERESRGELSFDERRRNILKSYDDVQACPGSGKTILVAAKLIILAKKWVETHKGICVLTHTNVAKREILRRLQNHPSGHRLASYPHFVGTIQEFVNRFLGLPYLRTNYEFNRFSEKGEANTEIYRAENRGFAMRELCNKLYRRCNRAAFADIKRFLSSTHYTNSAFDLGFYGQNGTFIHFSAANGSPTYKALKDLKERLNLSGVFQFRDMYAFAEKLLQDNLPVITSLRKRFPFAFVDEMQDTQKFQDDLINQIFNCEGVVLQRFGDPDQAIFNGMDAEKPNESYNSANLVPLAGSHRFGNDIARKIKGLSYNQLPNLRSIRKPPEGSAPHTIFLYDDRSIKQVLPAFGHLASESLTAGQRKTLKAVGGIGRENLSGLTIKHYWEGYDKNKAPKSFKATKLIHIVKKCAEHQTGNASDNYGLLFQGVLDLLRKADRKTKGRENKDVYYSKFSLIKELKTGCNFENIRRLLTSWIMHDFPSQDIWAQQMERLKALLDLDNAISRDAQDFISYDDYFPLEQQEQMSATNIYRCVNGQEIEVATIHAVKGQTHDATLIVETKYDRYWDIKESLEFLICDDKQRPPQNYDHPKLKTSIQASFLKRLYVAASRPRHLLCVALHKDNISSEQRELLKTKGWNFEYITSKSTQTQQAPLAGKPAELVSQNWCQVLTELVSGLDMRQIV